MEKTRYELQYKTLATGEWVPLTGHAVFTKDVALQSWDELMTTTTELRRHLYRLVSLEEIVMKRGVDYEG